MSLLKYTECEFDSTKITEARDEFEGLHAKIAGRSEGYKSITSPAGDEFSDLLGDGIKEIATENQRAWSSSLLACVHAYGVLDKAATDTDWYTDKITDIKARLRTEINSQQEESSALRGIRMVYDNEARSAWTKFVQRCEETEDILQDGPLPHRVRQLAEGGYFGRNEQVGYQSSGDVDYMLVSAISPELLARWVLSAPTSEHDLEKLEEDFGLPLLQSLVRRAQYAEENGLQLSEAELQFQEDFYAAFGEISTYDGFLDFTKKFEDRGELDAGKREEIQRTLANGLLVLSNETVGGGMSRLPSDVQEAAAGRKEFTGLFWGVNDTKEWKAWSDDFTALADLLDHAGPGMKGGTEFSTTLLGTVALDDNQGAKHLVAERDQTIIDVATRNPEASNIILTGKDFEGNTYEHHEHHQGRLTPEVALEALYTNKWEDGGKAVRGLTDWITLEDGVAEARGIPEGAQDKAMVEFMKLMENENLVEALGQTKHSVQYGEGDDRVEWRNVSATQLNPDLADGFADLFISYSDTFGHTAGLDPHKPVETGMNDNDDLRFSKDARLAFTQLAVGDPETAGRLYGEVRAMSVAAMYGYTEDTNAEAGARTGVLTGLVEQALINEAENRQENDEEAAARAAKAKSRALDLAAALMVDAKTPNVVATAFKHVVEDAWSDGKGANATSHVPISNEAYEKEFMTSIAIQALVEQDPSVMDRIEDKYPGKVVEGSGSERRIPFDPDDWKHPDGGSIVDDVLAEMGDQTWPGSDHRTAGEAVNTYIDTFNTRRGQWLDRGNG
ncbi:TPR repeat region-containing protein [Nocardiopsis metallicus]|uniref:TPR repeat domain-containing protein n=1 Tax=Nocardiopsis metallicus TaxID=179819 RepID=A0A840WHR9_9ACTN|nr:hypothetical protein [Nocardiopsis metallicus]MBB5491016.1 hypothetical protein [Nocardiopsis metallicus]